MHFSLTSAVPVHGSARQRVLPWLAALALCAFAMGCGSGLQTATEVQEILERRPAAPQADRDGKNLALLINGDHAPHHRENIARAYRTLLALGAEDEDIFILSSSNPRQSAPTNAVTAKATRRNLHRVMEALAQSVTTNDTLLVYGSGHGDNIRGRNVIVLADGALTDTELARHINGIGSAVTIVALDGCRTGGIPNLLSDSPQNVVAFSVTDDRTDTCCIVFAREFWEAPFDLRLDRNGDGIVSIREAFDHAMTAHRQAYPLYDNHGVFVHSREQADAWFHPSLPPAPAGRP
jgi:hypothetical protein